MGDVIKTGDTVEITIKGKVQNRSDHANTMRIHTDSGNSHYVYLGHDRSGALNPMIKDGETKYGVTVKKVEAFEPRQAYVDADGDIFIRTEAGKWRDAEGNLWNDDFASRPLRKLVPEA